MVPSPSPIREQPRKSPSWIGLSKVNEVKAPEYRGKNLLLKFFFVKIKMSHWKQNGTTSCVEWHFWALTGQPISISPIHVAFFNHFHRNNVLNSFVFFCPRGSVQSSDTKRTQRLGPGMLNRGPTWSKTYIDKLFKYVFYEFYTWFSLGQKILEPNFV